MVLPYPQHIDLTHSIVPQERVVERQMKIVSSISYQKFLKVYEDHQKIAALVSYTSKAIKNCFALGNVLNLPMKYIKSLNDVSCQYGQDRSSDSVSISGNEAVGCQNEDWTYKSLFWNYETSTTPQYTPQPASAFFSDTTGTESTYDLMLNNRPPHFEFSVT